MIREISSRQRAERIGRRAEWLAAMLLRLKGFGVIARRYRAPSGEVDLIARRGNLLAFVEVKARASLDQAVFAVSTRNRRRVGAAAALFLARHQHLAKCDIRYDIVAVAGWRLRHIASAWRDRE